MAMDTSMTFGYDFDNEDPDPRDDNGHGTHVAGTIGARGNNSIGVTGVGWNASLMALKVIGTGSNADVARAIDYATDNGAKITNNSYGYAGSNVGGSQTISNAVGRAKDAGVLYVVAAGIHVRQFLRQTWMVVSIHGPRN